MTVTGIKKEDDGRMVAWSVKSPRYLVLKDRWELEGDIGANVNSTWREL